MFVAFEGRLDAGDLHVLRRDAGGLAAAPALVDLAETDQDVALELVEFLLRQLAELEAHLRVEESIAESGVVVQLGVDGGGELVEHEADARDEQRIDDQHINALVPVSAGYSRNCTAATGPCT